MSYDLLDRVYSIMIDVMTGVSAGSGNAVFYNTDSHTSFIEVSITNGTQSFNMSEYNYQLVISKPDKTGYNNSYTTTDNSKLVIALDSDMLSGIGNNIAQLYVMKTINDVSKVVTMIEFNYTVKAGNYSALAPESVNQDSMYIALRTDVDSILSKIENGELGGGSGLTATQAEQLTTAYEHSQSPHITTADVNNAVSTYVTAHKAELKGDKGDKGDTGEKGDTGAKGEKGDTGAKGDKGDKGDTGATGANGITPTLKVGSTSTGNAGTNANVTMTSSNNVYTLNFVIPKGEKGDTGAKGDAGAAGAKGQDGAKGADGITPTLRVGTVTTLAAGSNATVTMSENNNVYTLNFGIPKGNKGDTGASGGSGETTVINPTITIGTVTNGDTASATITGDSPNYTLNLVLPKGAKGDKGDKGDTGADGAKGDKGDRGEKGTDGVTPTIAVGTTATGEAGTNAEVTMSKSGTTYTFNFVIPKGAKGDTGAAGTNGAKGDKGDKGEKGDTGAKGADGVTPTFEVGTVSTGAAGSTATVTITGTAPNYVLNFTIPKGDKGDAGEAGSGGDVDLTGYAKLTGATFTGKVTSPIVSATRYFETPTLVGEGDDSSYYHRVVFGHKNFDKMEFHEYGGSFSFFKNQKGGANDGQLLFQISTSGVDSKVPLKENGVRVYSPNNKPTAADLGITTGTNGATFTPSVDSEGNLSWSNDKGLANPNTVNIRGAKGDKGDKGDAGAKGDKGDPFTYSDFTPEQLTALKGAKGDKGDTGAKGDKGDKGDTGTKGADGQTPTISIGTVTTGNAGSSASAEITGTTPNLTLNLTIPKGDKGDKGDTGASGSGGTVSKTVKKLTSSASVTLTTDEYQYLEGNRDMSLTLPSVSTSTDITELHLFYLPNAVRTLTFSDSNIKWQNSVPNIEGKKWYEFIFTRTHTGVWLAGVVVYE